MIRAENRSIRLDGRRIDYQVRTSGSAQKLRVRVGPQGVEVIRPRSRTASDVESFLAERAQWIVGEIRRVQRLRDLRRPEQHEVGRILFRGESTRIRLVDSRCGLRGNRVSPVNGETTEREPHNGYLLFQGGIPEVDEFISSHWK